MNGSTWRKHRAEMVLFLLLFIFLLVSVFFYELLKTEKTRLSQSETNVRQALELEREHTHIVGQAEQIGGQEFLLHPPFGNAKEAFDALSAVFRQTGLRHSQFRQTGDIDGGVRFEVAGTDSWLALLSFLDCFATTGYPAKITAAGIDGAAGENISYRLTLDFLVKTGGTR